MGFLQERVQMMVKNVTQKFMIVNGWSDMNRGDSAIVLGLIWLLQKYFPKCSVYVMSEFSENDPKFTTGYQDIKNFYPDVDILPALFPYLTGRNKFLKIIDAGFTLFKSLMTLMFPIIGRIVFHGEKSKAWRRFVESDVIISKGGHIFYCSKPSFIAAYWFLKHAFPLLLGLRMRKKVIIYAQSVGPFHGKLCSRFAKWLFSRLSAVSVREHISRNTLYEIGVTKDIHVIPDAAFLLPVDIPSARTIATGHQIIITPRQWGFNNKEIWTRYINSLASVADWLIKEYGYSVLLVSHTIGPTPGEDDRVAVQQLYKAIASKEKVKVITTEGYNAFDMVRLYSDARLVIGTRFHSVILSLIAGVPVIAVSYFGPKTYGIMQDLKLSDFVADINTLDVRELKAMIYRILNNENQIRNEIVERIMKVRERAEKEGMNFLRSVFMDR